MFFWHLVALSIKRQFTYRLATLAGLATNYFFAILRAAVMVALYQNQIEINGLDLKGAITYTGLAQGMIAFLSLFSWFEIMNAVYTGQIGADLLKPMNYLTFWMAQDLGRALVNLLSRGVLIMLFYALAFEIVIPQHGLHWLALILTLFLAWLINFAFRYLINLSAFWSPNSIGFIRLFFAFSWLASGFLMPLRFYPDWFSRLCYFTPFPYTVNAITEVYLGLVEGAALIQMIVLQAAWALGLLFLGWIVFHWGVRHLTIQGG